MTAEIAIMNKEAIALAADSAVTIDTASGRKIFNTVNKLFTLSKHAPVAVMVYGRADLMGVPWESIIKMYRSELGDRRFNDLREYRDNFLVFLKRSQRLFPATQQVQYVRNAATFLFRRVRLDTEKQIREQIAKKGKVSPKDIRKAIDESIAERSNELMKYRRFDRVDSKRVARLRRKYNTSLEEVRKGVFEKLPLSQSARNKLPLLVAESLCRKVFFSDSYVVVAGFGDGNVFPQLFSMVVGGVADGLLRYEHHHEHEVSFDNPAIIIPFAQSDMVHTFMEGIDPLHKRVIKAFLESIFDKYPFDVLKDISSLRSREKTRLARKLRAAGKTILVDLDEELRKYQQSRHVWPVIQAIAVLPKDLLAEVAESLVNLTSFKRRISMDSAETVGGPIDVAVVSRGDGFVWIKRKHYFKPELNPSFFANYFGGRRVERK